MKRSLRRRCRTSWIARQMTQVKSVSTVWIQRTDSLVWSCLGQREAIWIFHRWFRVWDSRPLKASVSLTDLTAGHCRTSISSMTDLWRADSLRVRLFRDCRRRNCSSTRWVVVSVWLIRPWNPWRGRRQLLLSKMKFPNTSRLENGLTHIWITRRVRFSIWPSRIWNTWSCHIRLKSSRWIMMEMFRGRPSPRSRVTTQARSYSKSKPKQVVM